MTGLSSILPVRPAASLTRLESPAGRATWIDVAAGRGFRARGRISDVVEALLSSSDRGDLGRLSGRLSGPDRALAEAVVERLWHAGYAASERRADEARRPAPFARVEIDADEVQPLRPGDRPQPPGRTEVVVRAPGIRRGLDATRVATRLVPRAAFGRWTLRVGRLDCSPAATAALGEMDVGVRFRWSPTPAMMSSLTDLRSECVELCAEVSPTADDDPEAVARDLLAHGVTGVVLELPASWADDERVATWRRWAEILPGTSIEGSGDELAAGGWTTRPRRRSTARPLEVASLLDSAAALEGSCRSPQTPALQERLYPPAFVEEVSEVLDSLGCRRALDLCGGQGPLSMRLRRAVTGVCEFVVCDRDPFALALGRAQVAEAGLDRVSFRRCFAEATPFPDGSADAVVVSGAFDYFLEHDTVGRFLGEVQRLLSGRGRLLVLHPLRWVHPCRGEVEPSLPLSNHRFRAALESRGFQVREERLLRSFVSDGGPGQAPLAEAAAQRHLRLHPNYLLFSHPLSVPDWVGGFPVSHPSEVHDPVYETRYLSFALWVAAPPP